MPLYDIYSPVNPVAASSVQRWSVETNTVLKTCTTDAHQQKCQTDPFQACTEEQSCMHGAKNSLQPLPFAAKMNGGGDCRKKIYSVQF